ncbi:hypothetical protein BGZ99_003250, partial [Dissophora globulifera]
MLSEENLAWHTSYSQGSNDWRNFVQEFLDGLVSPELFEHMDEYTYEDVYNEKSAPPNRPEDIYIFPLPHQQQQQRQH